MRSLNNVQAHPDSIKYTKPEKTEPQNSHRQEFLDINMKNYVIYIVIQLNKF